MFFFPLLGDKKISLRYTRNTTDLPCFPSLYFRPLYSMKSVADALGNAADAVGNIADGVGNTADTVGNQFH